MHHHLDRPSLADRTVKRERVLDLLRRTGQERLVLTSVGSLSWYLDGARPAVKLSAEDGVIAVVVDAAGDTVFVPNNEADRLAAEELPSDVRVQVTNWWAPLLGPELAPGTPGVLTEADPVAVEGLRAARASLLPVETERYRRLGRDAAEALTATALSLEPRTTERETAARLGGELIARGAEPFVVLVAGEDRLPFRHALPTDGVLGRRVMLVVCARRHGLIANATRWVALAPPTAAETDADARIRAVETAFLAASTPGRPLGEVFAAGASAYADQGFPADEWTRHHQGGPTGYWGRDPVATPDSEVELVAGQAVAWNPSAAGVKIEDTLLLGEGGLEVLTTDGVWPGTRDELGLLRPDVLVRC
ncbi:M24 family metallopeptidase [Modestobacter sp. VKM Ac-2984]|uniref:M24 family metallopeptidase n=1 Tax=Modestobacter sp. VKM Ac-2984 TaxID=3004138 RepID=UPI0022AA4DC4|nr:M24 family metallopeptidase [Modestobacter sp. VKM Ac-2984]MCZ2815270.1 M24 family metallopeptidase [Modestobacter sp. VKM Ac-2984]